MNSTNARPRVRRKMSMASTATADANPGDFGGGKRRVEELVRVRSLNANGYELEPL